MKFLAFFVCTFMVVGTSETIDTVIRQPDNLWNYHSNDGYDNNFETSRKLRREAILKESNVHDHSLKLPPNYNKFELPKPADSPMNIFVFLNISKILDWDELNEFIRLDLRLKVMWTDFRILEFNNNTYQGNGKAPIETLTHDEIERMRKVNNDPAMLSLVWKPNLFIEGLLAVDQPVLMTKPLTVRYIPEFGWFEYITRIQIKIDCSMDFRYYPADTQVCSVPIRSYSYTKSSMKLSWFKIGVYLTNLEVSSFAVRLDEVEKYDIAKSEDPNEVHEVLGFKLYARRRLSYHLIQTYLASSFYIVITTLCFLLPSTMIEARIGMSMTTLLTLTAMFGSVRESTPIVSYTKAIDIWMVGCIFFVFLTLFQFTFSTWLKHVKKAVGNTPTKTDKKSKGIRNDAYEMDSKSQTAEADESGTVFSSETLEKYEKLSIFLETYSFPLFLGIFVVYSMVYWIWLFTASNYNDWNVNLTLNRI